MDSMVRSLSVNFLYPYRLKCQPINHNVLCNGLRCSQSLPSTILLDHRFNFAPVSLRIAPLKEWYT